MKNYKYASLKELMLDARKNFYEKNGKYLTEQEAVEFVLQARKEIQREKNESKQLIKNKGE